MEALVYSRKVINRLRSKGMGNTARYSLYVVVNQITNYIMDLRFGGKVCRTNLDEKIYNGDRHTMEHSGYHVLRDIFSQVSIEPDDILVDVGCGEGRVINFWLSLGLKNRIVGIEAVEAVAKDAGQRYRKYRNVTIIHGDALQLPVRGTIFFLYNPFSAGAVRAFEEKIRSLNPTVIYYHNLYMDSFLENDWAVHPVDATGHVYEFQAAVITRSRPSRATREASERLGSEKKVSFSSVS